MLTALKGDSRKGTAGRNRAEADTHVGMSESSVMAGMTPPQRAAFQRALLVKPAKRSPKPAKRIARGKAPRKVRKTSRSKMSQTADTLFSKIVRHGGGCVYHGSEFSPDCWGGGCAGPVQCAHIVSRTYRSVRWSEDNAMRLCAGAHVYMTHHPLEWENFVTMRIGDDAFAALKRRALVKWDGDIEGVLVRLASRAVVLGIQPGVGSGKEAKA